MKLTARFSRCHESSRYGISATHWGYRPIFEDQYAVLLKQLNRLRTIMSPFVIHEERTSCLSFQWCFWHFGLSFLPILFHKTRATSLSLTQTCMIFQISGALQINSPAKHPTRLFTNANWPNEQMHVQYQVNQESFQSQRLIKTKPHLHLQKPRTTLVQALGIQCV